MRQIQVRKRKNYQKSYNKRWSGGLDTLISSSEIKPNELSEAVDIQLVEDGKIQCPRAGQSYYGVTSGSKVTGLFDYTKSDGTKKLLRISGTKLQVYSSSAWTDVTGYTYTTTKDTNGVMAYDRLYLVNGTDPLTYYDGSTITSFTAISAPTNPVTTRTSGSAGSYTFSYKVTAVTATGETLPTAAATATLNQSTLDTTNYMTFTWTAATNATGYNVYGRKDGTWYFLKYLEGNTSTSYVDKGTDTPNELILPPDSNSTAGPIGKVIEVYKDTLFIFGDPSAPSRLYYSGGGDKINDFSASNGGGFIDISRNDGQMGTNVKIYRNNLVVFKERSVYQFSFTTSGAPSVTQITASVGCVSYRGVVTVENDLFFVSERGIFTLGNEAGFAFDILRTNEGSAKVRTIFQSIQTSRLANISTVYATKDNVNIVIFAYTPSGSTYNSKAIIYDRERQAWYRWTNIQANCWVNFIDSSKAPHVLYGDDNSGYVKEVLEGDDDFGTSIQGTFQLKAEDFGALDQYKTLKDFSVVLRNATGTVQFSIIQDGTTTAYNSNIASINPSVNFGHYVFTEFLLGTSSGTGSVTASDENVLRTKKNLNIQGRTFAGRFTNGTSGASFTLLAFSMLAKPKSPRYRQSTDLIA